MWPLLLTTLAVVNLRITPRIIDPDTAAQRGGVMTMRVDGFDFNFISRAEPNFIRIRLDQGTRLAHTVVDTAGRGLESEPINLALSTKAEGATLLAPEDTVQIVRWRRGETAIWLRVNVSSHEWLNTDEYGYGWPSIQRPVQWTIGRSREEDLTGNQRLYSSGQANLRANLRHNQPVDTFIMVDTRLSTLTEEGKDQQISVAAFLGSKGVRTETDPTAIQDGSSGTLAFITGDRVIGWAEDRPSAWAFNLRFRHLEASLSIFNPHDEGRPISILAHNRLAYPEVFVVNARPGVNTLPMDSDAMMLEIVESNGLEYAWTVSNRSGHRFAFPMEAQTGARHVYAINDHRKELQLCLFNPGLGTANATAGLSGEYLTTTILSNALESRQSVCHTFRPILHGSPLVMWVESDGAILTQLMEVNDRPDDTSAAIVIPGHHD